MGLTEVLVPGVEREQREQRARAVQAELDDVMGLANTVQAQLVAVVARALRHGLWHGAGIRSPEHWLVLRAGLAGGHAHRIVAMAETFESMPRTAGLFAGGRISEDQAYEILARVPAAYDDQAAAFVEAMTVPQLRRAVRALPPPEPAADEPAEPAPAPGPERRVVRFGFDDAGRWRIHGELPADEGARVQAALEAQREQLWRAMNGRDGDDVAEPPIDRVDWADALVGLADGLLTDPDRDRGRAARADILIHWHTDTGTARWHRGPGLARWLLDYVACDARLRFLRYTDGIPVEFTSARDTVDWRLRTLIEHRDHSCRVPGCGQTRWLHIHHLIHRADGGPTRPSNLLALCPYHHRAHHRGEFLITGDPTRPDGLTFTRPDGRPAYPTGHPTPPTGPPPDHPRYQPPGGEPVQWKWFDWNPPEWARRQ